MIEMAKRIEGSSRGRREMDDAFSAAPWGRSGVDQSKDGHPALPGGGM